MHFSMSCIFFWTFSLLHFTYSGMEVKVIIKRCSDDYASQSDDTEQKDRRSEEYGINDDEHFPGIVRRRIDLEREFEMDEPEYPFHLTRCERKLLISLWIKSGIITSDNSTDDEEQLIYVDHGYDAVTSRIVKLLSPVTIRFRQQPVLQVYPFRNIHVVNGLAHEEIVNKDETPNFTGCDDTSSNHPTCSFAYKKGKPIPYSQGFCCYCTASGKPPAHLLVEEAQASRNRNLSRLHARTTSEAPLFGGSEDPVISVVKVGSEVVVVEEANTIPPSVVHEAEDNVSDQDTSDSQYVSNDDEINDMVLIDDIHSRFARQDQSGVQSQRKHIAVDRPTNVHSGAVESALSSSKFRPSLRQRRSLINMQRHQRFSLVQQPRGGQDCTSDTPNNVDPDKYLSSAHCLRLHDIWYNVNAIQMPHLRHSVQLQVYTKKELPDGSQRWSDLNSGKIIVLGTESMHYMENNQTLGATYSGKVLRRDSQVIPNVTDKMLLIPQMTASAKMRNEYPQLQGPGEYLLVSRSLVDLSGKTCDKIGVTYSTFALQQDRCEKPRGACLTNQPIHLWERDKRSGGLHRYRLAGFGIPHRNAIEANRASGEYLLMMKHTSPYTSYIDVEVDADGIGILRTGLHAQITNVFTMSGERVTVVTVVVTNTGLVSSVFSVQIASCSHKVPDSRRAPFNIAPQNQATFNITLSHGSEIIKDKIVCSTLVRNSEHKVVAARRIHAYPHDRCVCVWFCLCACTSERFACTPMSLAHYRSSGFLGDIPSVNKSRLPYIAEIVLDLELILLSLTVVSIMLGCLKAFVGLVFPDSVGLLGLGMCNDKPRKIDHYYEMELRDFPVEYDGDGYPVHPLTKSPSVRRMSGTLRFCLNVAWFFYMPLSLWYWVRTRRGCLPSTCRALCCCSQRDGSPSSRAARQSLLSSQSDSVPSDVSEYRAQSYGGTGVHDIALDQYRQSRDELRSPYASSLVSTGGLSRVRSFNSMSRSSLAGSSADPASLSNPPADRRSSSARSVTSSVTTRSPGRSSTSRTGAASARRLSQMQGVPNK